MLHVSYVPSYSRQECMLTLTHNHALLVGHISTPDTCSYLFHVALHKLAYPWIFFGHTHMYVLMYTYTPLPIFILCCRGRCLCSHGDKILTTNQQAPRHSISLSRTVISNFYLCNFVNLVHKNTHPSCAIVSVLCAVVLYSLCGEIFLIIFFALLRTRWNSGTWARGVAPTDVADQQRVIAALLEEQRAVRCSGGWE